MYLSYDEYKTYGGILPEVDFDRFRFRAERLIDNETQERVKSLSNISEEIKRCMFELITYLSNYGKNGDISAVSGFGNDGYSVTYAEVKSSENQIHAIIYDYLITTGLMYCGVE